MTTPKLSVLVVDDYVDGREMVAEYLAFRGFSVVQAQGGDEAIALAKKLKPDVILMDLRMPGTDGWEATRQIKADPITSHILIVALTAHAMTSERESARKAGCDAVVAKPYDLAALSQAVLRAPKAGAAAFDILSPGRSRAVPRRQHRPERRLNKRES